mmetsp:Transcript_34738/g.39578  ORF Transcript_34738/g.39578 Transcript_34738/m.39578 type:complete len:589 (-) Transcript_34738:189-1955(-)|eukprot:CAMPEP_0194134908 /NCGR_PEP_ID=MMETSP0152-20130528/4972_1 /TAXON_ID=1049557 /ORGANISM="Thalassiothrix antarctica, Strain L6-D1" /LENGTH=588 /DNA_ID=CAMNT_0038830857 /DNA_START=187 /DNA_END=1953 /DNA_ORIENTATION=-
MSSDTTLHDLCKGFGALLSRSKNPSFPEEAARLNERGNLPLHAACSFQATADVVEALLKAYPGGASQPNSAGNLPVHQAAMWQAPVETLEMLLARHPEGTSVRNQYGSLPLHMAASNQASPEVVRILIDSYPDALHLQNDDGMTPLDLGLADESASEAVIAMLEGRPPPPELTRRQKAEKYEERAKALERKLGSLKDTGGRQGKDLHEALLCVRRLADRFPHSLYAAGLDPNELEIAFSERQQPADSILLDAVKRRSAAVLRDSRGAPLTVQSSMLSSHQGPRDRVEDLLASIVGLDHVKSQVRGLRRTTEISDLKESLLPTLTSNRRGTNALALISPALSEDTGRPRANHMVFIGNPGTGKTAVARLLAKAYHELGLLRKPKFLEVERMDLVGRDREQTILKTQEVLDEARGGILFIDEAYTLGMASKRNRIDTGADAITEIVKSIERAENDSTDTYPLIILAGFPVEMQTFLSHQPELRKKFDVTFEFSDYNCEELSKIFLDLTAAKGFDMDDDLSEDIISHLLEQETTVSWRTERNGRVCEQLMAGCRTQVRRRMRQAQMEEDDEFDPNLIIRRDIESVMSTDFK